MEMYPKEHSSMQVCRSISPVMEMYREVSVASHNAS